jgi:hypothetical protein
LDNSPRFLRVRARAGVGVKVRIVTGKVMAKKLVNKETY